MKRGLLLPLSLLILVTMVISGCTASISNAAQSADSTESGSSAQLDFTLQTNIVDGQMVYVGAGGDIDGVVNPDLPVLEWEGYGLWGHDDPTKCKAIQIDADNQMRVGYCGWACRTKFP